MWNFYFQIFEETIKSEQVIEFLKHLLRYIQGDILLIWDRLPAHKSKLTINSVDIRKAAWTAILQNSVG